MSLQVYAMCAIQAGYDTLGALGSRLPVAGVIGLAGDVDPTRVSGHMSGEAWCGTKRVPYFPAVSYNLSAERDREILLGLDIDLLLVVGWQRLIPSWLIRHSGYGAIGIHGSANGITSGRGRSPQNWALILGHESFSLSIFRIGEDVDSGPVIATRTFRISNRDDIRSTYYKTCLLAADMIAESYDLGTLLNGGEPQSGTPYYLPQRTADDGEIDWRRSTKEIDAFVRAQTRPYPGAFSRLGDERITIWKAHPLEVEIGSKTSVPGEIIQVFTSNDFVVRTGDGLLLIESYGTGPTTLARPLHAGQVLQSADYRTQMRTIIVRHRLKNPDSTLHPDILAAVGDC